MRVKNKDETFSVKDVFYAVLLGCISFVVYAVLCQKGISWGDSGLRQHAIVTGNSFYNYGVAGEHPLYILCGNIFTNFFSSFLPVSPFTLANVFSGIFASLSLAMTFLVVRMFSVSRLLAAFAVITLGGAHTMIVNAVQAEVYSMSLFFMVCEVLCALMFIRTRQCWFAVLLALVNGLHFSVHNLALLNLPVWVFVFASHISCFSRPMLLLIPFVWLIGALLVLKLFFVEICEVGFLSAVKSLLVGNYGKAVLGGTIVPWRVTAVNFCLSALNFFLPFWAVFIVELVKRRLWHSFLNSMEKRILFFLSLIHVLFWVRYRVADQVTFILPVLFFCIMFGVFVLRNLSRRVLLILIALTPFAVWLVPNIGVCCVKTLRKPSLYASLPYRDNVEYFLFPWKCGEDSAERFIKELSHLKSPAYIFADFSAEAVIRCAQASGRMPEGIRLASQQDCAELFEKPDSEKRIKMHIYEVRPFFPYRQTPSHLPIHREGVFWCISQ